MISRRLIRIKVLQIFYSFSKKEDYTSIKAEKELFYSIERFYDLYHLLLLLIVEISKLEKEKFEKTKGNIYKHKNNDGLKLHQNKALLLLSESSVLKEALEEKKLNWIKNDYIVKKLYDEFIESDIFADYSKSKNQTNKNDLELLVKFYTVFLAENKMFNEFLEEESIYWVDDFTFALVMVLKTIKSLKFDSDKQVNLLPIYKNEDDKEFAKKLLQKSIVNSNENIEIIKKYAKNWEAERFAQIDLLILQLAITELLEFPTIPIKVSLNEFIEISKYYSTTKSKAFINGLLDNIISDFKKEGKINKTGRGLIVN